MNKFKSFITLSVLGIAVLASCQQEKEIDITPLSDGEVAFYMPSSKATKASSGSMASIKGAVIPVGEDENGTSIYLEESISYLGSPQSVGPQTKGTPVYTGNFINVSNGSFKSTVKAATDSGPETVLYPNEVFKYDEKKFFRHDYPNGLWNNAPLNFYMWMPGTMNEAEITSMEGGKITFNYDGSKLLQSGEEEVLASQMQDLLFASRHFTDRDATGDFESYDMVNGAPLLFQHALTGVKFATANHISNEETGTKTIIDKVVFKNLKDKGTCVVTSIGQEDNPTAPYELDNTTYYSSGMDTYVYWTDASSPKSGTLYAQTFTEDNFVKNPYSSHYDYDSEGAKNDGFFPDSFYYNDAAWAGSGTHRSTDWNMNDKDATLTFWFMPQQLSEDVELEVTFHIVFHTNTSSGTDEWEGQPITRTIKFGDLTRAQKTDENGNITYGDYPTWRAGELRTYVLKAQEVDVEIVDQIVEGTKKDLQITNVGNVPEYVRATIIAYWADANGNAVFGYTEDSVTKNEEDGSYTLNDNAEYVEPWTLEKEKSSSTAIYGTMTNFYPSINSSDWVIGTDGYYYYVGGDQNGVLGVDQSSTKVLFDSYELKTIPDIYQIDQKTLSITKVSGVKLIMEVVCQAVIAKETSSGGFVAWNDAWKEALEYDPKPAGE